MSTVRSIANKTAYFVVKDLIVRSGNLDAQIWSRRVSYSPISMAPGTRINICGTIYRAIIWSWALCTTEVKIQVLLE